MSHFYYATGGCGLVVANSAAFIAPKPIASGLNQLLPSSEPPATIVSLPVLSNNEPITPCLPAADIGLMAPQIMELLPNPLGTGNDSTDEYIELYNANDSPFNLTGFALQSGLTTLRSYLFPHGLSLQSHSFTAFYATQTKVTLSNSGSQVKLIDSLGNSIKASDPYSAALVVRHGPSLMECGIGQPSQRQALPILSRSQPPNYHLGPRLQVPPQKPNDRDLQNRQLTLKN